MPKPDYERLNELRAEWISSKRHRANLRIALRMARAGHERAKKRMDAQGDENSNMARRRFMYYVQHGVELTPEQEAEKPW